MMLSLLIWNSTTAQSLETDFSLTAAGGSVSNTYLMPVIPEWDRSRISGFSSVSPSGQLWWRGSGRSAALYGSAHLLHFYDNRPTWIGGFLAPVFRQHIASGFSARASGGWSYFSSTYSRSMNWLHGGMEWIPTPFTKFEVTAGSGWRTYRGLEERPEETRRYDSYGLEFQYWPGYRWQVRTSFQSSLAHIRRPSDGFAVSVAVAHYRRNGMSIMLQTGLEQYSTEFQSDLTNGSAAASEVYFGMPVFSAEETMQNDEIIRMEDRFHRTTLRGTYPVADWITLTGSISGLLWFSSEDNDIVSDYQVSAGVQIPISVPTARAGEIRSMSWNQDDRHRDSRDRAQNQNQKLQAELTVRYRGDATLYITGDFNDWDDPGIPLQKTGRNRYRVEIDLSAGVYEYKIGKRTNDSYEWLEFPDDVSTVNDGFGGLNGRLFIDY